MATLRAARRGLWKLSADASRCISLSASPRSALKKPAAAAGDVSKSSASVSNRFLLDDSVDLAGADTETAKPPQFPKTNHQSRPANAAIELRPRAMECRPLQHNSLLLRLSHVQRGDQCVPVKAFYISRSVDLKALKDEPLIETVNYSRTTLVARCKFPLMGRPHFEEKPKWQDGSSWVSGPFLVVFHYGSAVLVNFQLQEEEERYLKLVKKHCLEALDHTEEARKDDYKIVVRPTLATWSQAGYDTIFLKKLDLDNVRVVCSILAQSVALEHHLRKADGMVNIFSKLNSKMEETGNFTMSRKELFQLVASANTTLADLVLRVRLLDRSESAWKDARYAGIWEYLHEEFEMFDRFENINFKLKTIQKNVEFFLEVLQNRKSDLMEWLIIILISFELSVSIYAILRDSVVAVS